MVTSVLLLVAAAATAHGFVLTPGRGGVFAPGHGRLGAVAGCAGPRTLPGTLERASRVKVRRGATTLKAAFPGYESMLALDTPAAWAAFLLWSVPLPATIGSFMLRMGKNV